MVEGRRFVEKGGPKSSKEQRYGGVGWVFEGRRYVARQDGKGSKGSPKQQRTQRLGGKGGCLSACRDCYLKVACLK